MYMISSKISTFNSRTYSHWHPPLNFFCFYQISTCIFSPVIRYEILPHEALVRCPAGTAAIAEHDVEGTKAALSSFGFITSNKTCCLPPPISVLRLDCLVSSILFLLSSFNKRDKIRTHSETTPPIFASLLHTLDGLTDQTSPQKNIQSPHSDTRWLLLLDNFNVWRVKSRANKTLIGITTRCLIAMTLQTTRGVYGECTQ